MANHKIGANEAENTTLSGERDQALKRLQAACENINDLMARLEQREKELHSTQKQLNATQNARQNNDTLKQDIITLKHGYETLQLENKALKADNSTLRRDQQTLQEEIESLRADNNNLRREQESLIQENRSLRSSNQNIMVDNGEQRHSVEAIQQELDAAREEVENLQNEIQVLEQEKVTFREDNDSLVRHNEKYFSENKLLRRENSGFERSIHDLHDENLRLRDEIEFLKQQLDHCRPIGKDADLSEDEENMTSAFFVPDITMNSNENSANVDATSQSTKPPILPEITSHSNKLDLTDITHQTRESTAALDNTFQSETPADPAASSKAKGKEKALATRDHTAQGQRVAFSIPESSAKSKSAANVANQGSKRRIGSHPGSRQSSKGGMTAQRDPFQDTQDSAAMQSQDETENVSISLRPAVKAKSQKEASVKTHKVTTKQTTLTENVTSQSYKGRSTNHSHTNTQNVSVNLTSRSAQCPVLSREARRVLDGLCEHNCRNCIVCSRIVSHRGAITAAEMSEGKKRVTVPRPVPVSDRFPDAAAGDGDEHTTRPAQPPGRALALVIKGLEDEAEHMKMELASRQARYAGLSAAVGRRERRELAAEVTALVRRLEAKRDQIYALYDVLEGQRASGQAMTEEELEMTVLSIMSMGAREVSEQVTWDGIQG